MNCLSYILAVLHLELATEVFPELESCFNHADGEFLLELRGDEVHWLIVPERHEPFLVVDFEEGAALNAKNALIKFDEG